MRITAVVARLRPDASYQVINGDVLFDDPAVAPLTPEEIARAEAEIDAQDEAAQLGLCIARIKAEARRRILARYAWAKQSNMNMRANELQDVRYSRAWTAEEEAEAAELRAAAGWIRTVRARSDELERQAEGKTPPELRAWDVSHDRLWV